MGNIFLPSSTVNHLGSQLSKHEDNILHVAL